MSKYTVHASRMGEYGRKIPFLTLEALPDSNVKLNFEHMVAGEAEPAVILPARSVYELLEGKDITVETGFAQVKLSPRHEELIIDFNESRAQNMTQYRVSMTELALAWNMIQGTPDAHQDQE